MNFDIAVYAGLAIVGVIGFNTGLLRSAITILAYLLATPLAVWAMTFVSSRISGNPPRLCCRTGSCSSARCW
jgi:membrane protein required for colicin V production